jgi:uncharacterized protein (TIRG00374 family)
MHSSEKVRGVNKQALIVALKYSLGLGLLAWVIIYHWHIESNGEEVGLAAALQRPFHWPAFAIAFAITTLSVLITFVRWFILVRAQNLPFTPSNALRLGLIGFYLSTFMPGSVGGDIIKAFAIAREQSRRTVAVATVLFDRFVGLCGLFWLVTLLGSIMDFAGVHESAGISPQARTVLRGILITAVVLSLGSLVFWFVMGFFAEPWSERMAQRLQRVPKIGMSLAELWRAVWMFRRRTKSVALALGLSLVSHCGFVLAFYFSVRAVMPPEAVPSLPAHFLIVPVGMTIQAGVPTPGGVGAAEYGFGALYQLINFTFAAGTLGSLVQRVITWVLGFLGYLVYLRMKSSLVPVEDRMPVDAAV